MSLSREIVQKVRDLSGRVSNLEHAETTPIGEVALTSAYYRADSSLHTPGDVLVGGQLGIGTASPGNLLDLEADVVGYAARIFNDGNATTRRGLLIQANLDANPDGIFVGFQDGDGGVVGTIIGDGAGGVDYNQTSDERVKDDIESITSSLDKILALNPVKYRGKGAPKNRPKTAGLIAQQVLQHIPEAVTQNDDGLMMLAYNKIIPHLVKSIQELEVRVVELEAA